MDSVITTVGALWACIGVEDTSIGMYMYFQVQYCKYLSRMRKYLHIVVTCCNVTVDNGCTTVYTQLYKSFHHDCNG